MLHFPRLPTILPPQRFHDVANVNSYFKLVGFRLLQTRTFHTSDFASALRAWQELEEERHLYSLSLDARMLAMPLPQISVWARPKFAGPWRDAILIGECGPDHGLVLNTPPISPEPS